MTAEQLASQAGITLPAVAAKRARADVATEEQLLAAIRKSPDGAEPWQAYATWLCAQGDPLGQRVIVGRAARELAKREADVMARHRDVLLGRLAPWVERGWLEITWHHGYFRYVEIDVDSPLGLRERDLVDALFDHPSAKILTELRLSGFDIRAYEQQKLVDAVIARRPATLRELEVSGVAGMSCGDLSKVWSAFPELRALTAFGRDVELGEIDAPALVRLDVHLMGLTGEVVNRIAAARAPKLATLRLAGVVAKDHLAALQPILAGTTLPALDKLLLSYVEGADEVAAAVLAAPKLTCVAFWHSELGKSATAKLRARFGDKLYL